MGFISWLFGAKPKAITKLKVMGLSSWYESTFSNEQRSYIEATLLQTEKRATSERGMSFGDITIYSDKCQFLTKLGECFDGTKEARDIAIEFCRKATEVGSEDLESHHFAFHFLISKLYKNRDEGEHYLQSVIEACEGQIAIAARVKKYCIEYRMKTLKYSKKKAVEMLPGHIGFKQLAIIYEKQKDYEAVIALCRRAQTLKWPGDWDKRIERCKSRLEKAKK